MTAGFEFDVPVRFDTDRIQTSVASFQAGDVPDVPVVEVRAMSGAEALTRIWHGGMTTVCRAWAVTRRGRAWCWGLPTMTGI